MLSRSSNGALSVETAFKWQVVINSDDAATVFCPFKSWPPSFEQLDIADVQQRPVKQTVRQRRWGLSQ